MNTPSEKSIKKRRSLLGLSILILLAEKSLQHIVVSLAFYFNWQDIASTVDVDPMKLFILGLFALVLFGVAFFGMWYRKAWAPWLAAAMATFDIIGEFIAQDTLMISMTVSFLVACTLLILAITYLRRQPDLLH